MQQGSNHDCGENCFQKLIKSSKLCTNDINQNDICYLGIYMTPHTAKEFETLSRVILKRKAATLYKLRLYKKLRNH